jgi:hypothetical protein
MRGVKDASLGFSFLDIQKHCIKATKDQPDDVEKCIDLNCFVQGFYIECFEVYRDKKMCLKLIGK